MWGETPSGQLAAVSGGLSSVGGGPMALQSDLSRAPDRVLPSGEGGVGPGSALSLFSHQEGKRWEPGE